MQKIRWYDGVRFVEPVQNLYYLGKKSLIGCDSLLTYRYVCCAAILANQGFFAKIVEILNWLVVGLLMPVFAHAATFPGFTDSQAMPNFEKTIQSLSQKTKLPVVFPQKIPILPKRNSYYIYVETQDFGSRYMISFDTTPDCHAKHSCSIGSLTVSTGGNPQIYYTSDNKVLTTLVELAGGKKAYFTPSHAAADFWPSQLEWREGNVFYRLGWNLVANAPEKEVLVAMANSIKKIGV